MNNTLKAISRMSEADLLQVEASIKLRRTRLRQVNPVAYTVSKRPSESSQRSYLTMVRGEGNIQFLTRDFDHPHLKLFSSREDAQSFATKCAEVQSWESIMSRYNVVEVSKKELKKLPCYRRYYYQFASFAYVPDDEWIDVDKPEDKPVGTITLEQPITMFAGETLEIIHKAS
jgi:hypothetical protein